MENTFLYFGYGSSLNPMLVEFRVNETVKLLGKATLRNYAVKFNRQNPDGSARANLIAYENETTYGLLYEINGKKFELLAQTEPFYDLVELEVETENGIKKAFVFISESLEDNIYPQEKYLKCILEAAAENEFPKEYIQKISAQAKAIENTPK
jgi:hypothetical protein